MFGLRAPLMVGAALVLSLVGTSAATAADFSVSLDKSVGLSASGDTIKVTTSNLPSNAGLYVRQCASPTLATARATDCNGQGVWVTSSVPAGTPGTAVPGSVVQLPVEAKFTTASGAAVDCTTRQCGVFIRRDHLAPADTALDKFLPIAFIGDSIAKPSDAISATLNGVAVNTRTPMTLRYRTPATLVLTSASGTAVTLTALNSNCVVTGTTVTAVKAQGECAVMATTAPSAGFARGQAIFPAYLASGLQTIDVTVPEQATIGQFVALGKATMRTSLNQPVKWKSLTRGCVVSTSKAVVTVTSYRARTCEVLAYSPARSGLWNQLKQTYSVTFAR